MCQIVFGGQRTTPGSRGVLSFYCAGARDQNQVIRLEGKPPLPAEPPHRPKMISLSLVFNHLTMVCSRDIFFRPLKFVEVLESLTFPPYLNHFF